MTNFPPNNLKRLRKAKGLRANAIAEKLGVSAAQVSRWENSRNDIPGVRLPQLAEAYGISVSQIYDDESSSEGEPGADGPPQTITISLANLAAFVRRVLNGGQEGPYSQDDALEIVRALQSALEAARSNPETLDDPAMWATFLHGYAAGKPFGSRQ